MKNTIIETLKIVIMAVVLSVGIGYVFASSHNFVGPSLPPPQANTDAPINVGVISQTKFGNLGITGDFAANRGFFGGMYVGTDVNPLPVPAGNIVAEGKICDSGGTNCIGAGGGGSGFWSATGADISNTNAGNVGIGTSAPKGKLDVAGVIVAGNGHISTGASNGALVLNAGVGGDIWFRSSGLVNGDGLIIPYVDQMIITSAGNVGIGTMTPTAKLDVAGDVSLNGKHAFRSSDSWLRLNQTKAFTSGIHTPYNMNVGGMTVGLLYYDPGAGNLEVAGNANIKGKLQVSNIKNTLAHASGPGTWPWSYIGSVSMPSTAATGLFGTGWIAFPLSTTKNVLGIYMDGNSDNGGTCVAYIENYITVGNTRGSYFTNIQPYGNWDAQLSGGDWGNMTGRTIIFEGAFGRNLGPQSYANNFAYDEPAGLTYIPPGKSLHMYGQYWNTGGPGYVTCNVYVLYSDV